MGGLIEVLFRMKLKNLIRHLGDQLDIPEEALRQMDLDNFVESAIKQADGEGATSMRVSLLTSNDRPVPQMVFRKRVDPMHPSCTSRRRE